MLELLAFLVIAAIAIAVVGAIAALIVLIACSTLLDKWYDDEAKKGGKYNERNYE